ncbi:MAG: glycoside hydrolase domain-containing protein [Anaerolineales bacterium]
MSVNRIVHKRHIILTFIIMLPWLVAAVPLQVEPNGPIVWVEDGMTTVFKTDAAGTHGSISLYTARNEYEPFQIIIKAPASNDLTNVNITISDLKGDKGSLISAENIDLYREHYLYITQGSKSSNATTNPPLGPGWYPDALIPFKHPDTKQDLTGQLDAVPFNIEAGENQPIWVDIFTPKGTPAGKYKGNATITSDQGTGSIEIILSVWNFALPDTRSLKGFTNTLQPLRTRTNAITLLKHRISPKWVNREDERFLIENYGIDMVHVFGSGGASFGNCRTGPPPEPSELVSAIQGHAPGLYLFTSYANEIWQCIDLFPQFLSWAENLRLAGIHPMIVTYPDDQLMGKDLDHTAADIWSILPRHYEQAKENVKKLVEHPSTQVWSYNPLVQDGYSPKFTIDFPLINARIMVGFINQSLGFTGTKFWRVDNWTNNPWQNAEAYRVDAPGEGHMVYPGEEVGLPGMIIPGVRMKMFREGSEDYEYIQILKDIGQEQFALSTARSVGADFQNWTHDKNELYAARKILGDKIHQLNSIPGSLMIGSSCLLGNKISPDGSQSWNMNLFDFISGAHKRAGTSSRVPCF